MNRTNKWVTLQLEFLPPKITQITLKLGLKYTYLILEKSKSDYSSKRSKNIELCPIQQHYFILKFIKEETTAMGKIGQGLVQQLLVKYHSKDIEIITAKLLDKNKECHQHLHQIRN